ncbi:MAG: endonuclease [Rubrivivax sp.]
MNAPTNATPQRQHVDIVTWNVQWFCGLDEQVDVDRVVAHAKAFCDFDVLCLQEVAVDYPEMPGNAGFDQPARVREALGPDYEVLFAPAVDELGAHGRRQQFGNLLATRLPAALVQRLALPWPADGEAMSMPRVCLSATIGGPFGPLRVMTTHLEYYSKRQRMAQAMRCATCTRRPASAPPRRRSTRPTAALSAASRTPRARFFAATSTSKRTSPSSPRCKARSRRRCRAWPTRGRACIPGSRRRRRSRLFDRRYGPDPIACDFFFVSTDLLSGVQRFEIDSDTRLSDHQPMWLRLGPPA